MSAIMSSGIDNPITSVASDLTILTSSSKTTGDLSKVTLHFCRRIAGDCRVCYLPWQPAAALCCVVDNVNISLNSRQPGRGMS